MKKKYMWIRGRVREGEGQPGFGLVQGPADFENRVPVEAGTHFSA